MPPSNLLALTRAIGAQTVTIAALLVSMMFTGCQYIPFDFVPIGTVTGDPSSFDGQVVKLRGTVAGGIKLPFIPTKGYLLEDRTGTIMVLTEELLPAKGKQLAICGQVMNALVIDGVGLGYAVRERNRLPLYGFELR